MKPQSIISTKFLNTAFLLILLSGCSDNNSPSPVSVTPIPSPTKAETVDQTDSEQADFAQEDNTQMESTEPATPFVPSPELRYQRFMSADEYGQQEMVNNMENTGEDVALMAQLITKNISSEAKQAMLQTLMYGEHDEVAPVIYLALHDSDPDVVVAAIDGLRTLDSPADIPPLERLVRRTGDEDIRDAAKDAIDFLTP